MFTPRRTRARTDQRERSRAYPALVGLLGVLGLIVLTGCAADEATSEEAERPLPPPSVEPSQPAGTAPTLTADRATDPGDVLDEDLAAALEEDPPELAALAEAADEYDVEADLIAALAWHESRWDHAARSHAGAVGVLQVMPSTAERVSDRLREPLDPVDLEDNAIAGTAYLAGLKADFATVRRALIAYNMGSVQLRDDGPLTESEEFADRVLETRDQLAQVDWEPTASAP